MSSTISEKLGSSSKDNKKDKEEDHGALCAVEPQCGEELIQRCVIIHKDEKGYGLTVSGDNPVFVQLVKKDGAAERAGVRQGDRIVKVNGTLVTHCNHTEVVKLIKSGTYVALTVLGRPPNSSQQKPLDPPPQPHYASPGSINERVSKPQGVDPELSRGYDKHKMATIRVMYDQTAEEVEQLKISLDKNKNDSDILRKIMTKESILQKLGEELYSLTGIPAESHVTSPSVRSPPSGYPPPVPLHSYPLRQAGSGDAINQLREETEHSHIDSNAHHPIANPTPWLPHGPRHKKADSMPDTLYEGEESLSGSKENKSVTVSRSHSDSHKHDSNVFTEIRERTPAEQLKTSLQTNVYDSGNVSDQSPRGSPATSPMPHGAGEALTEGTVSESIEDLPAHGHLSPDSARMSSSPSPHQYVSPQKVEIISYEDDFSTDDEHLDEHGPFSDLVVLKHKSAHLAVFLHYLISNSDPNPMLFYLVTDTYTQGTVKEMKRWAYEIHSTYLVDKAPLKVNVHDDTIATINQTLQNKGDKEDALKVIFSMARHEAQREIGDLLSDFRTKRALGLGSLYGDHELQDINMDKVKIVEKYLVPHFERFQENEENVDRNIAMASALGTILKNMGVPLTKGSSSLERHPTFVSKEKKIFKISKKKIQNLRNHQFQATFYYMVTYCNYCQGLIWGIGPQGYQCNNCEQNFHRNCIYQAKENCSGKSKKKRDRTSMLGFISRKPSTNNPSAIEKALIGFEEKENKKTNPLSPLPFVKEDMTTKEKRTPKLSTGSSVFYPSVEEETEGSHSDYELDRHKEKKAVGISGNRSNAEIGITHDGKTTPPRSKSPEPSQPTTDLDEQSDVQVDQTTLRSLDKSSSSSNSSLPTKNLESPNNSQDCLNHIEDSDFEVEPNLPTLEEVIPKEILKKLKPKEKKRQDVINELFYTEKAHVRNLKVMNTLYNIPMQKEPSIPDSFVKLLFPNLEQLILVHSSMNKEMKEKKKESPLVGEVADILLNRFDGEAGLIFKETCAMFCENQSHALDSLRIKQRKDTKFGIYMQEIANNHLNRRLELKDYLPTAMQRLTKYPLLIENLMKYTQANAEEHEKLARCLVCCKDILAYVNQAVSDCENYHKLVGFQKRLDKRAIENSNHVILNEYRNLDLTQHSMVYDGPLTWRVTKSKLIDLQVVLLEDILVLLQKQDEKLVLKCQSNTLVTGKEDTKFTHVPIIKLTNLLIKEVANEKRAFFLVSTSAVGPQIYELIARSVEEKKKWFKYIKCATNAKEGQQMKNPVFTPVTPSGIEESKEYTNKESKDEGGWNRKDSKDESEMSTSSALDGQKSPSMDSIDNIVKAEVLQINQPELIQPTEVVVSDTRFEQAEPVLSPLENFKRKEVLVVTALKEKQDALADVLQVPAADFFNIAEIADEIDEEREPKELVLASISQIDALTSLINEGLSLPSESSEQEGIEEVGGATGVNTEKLYSSEGPKKITVTLPSAKVLSITSKLNQHFGGLIPAITKRDKEVEQLHLEVKALKEQLEFYQQSSIGSMAQDSRPNSFISVTSSASDVAEILEETPQVSYSLQTSSDESAFATGTSSPQTVLVVQEHFEKEVELVTSYSTEDKEHCKGDSEQGDDEDENGFVDARTDYEADINLNVPENRPHDSNTSAIGT